LSTVDPAATVVAHWDSGQVRWWTWAGARANALLATALTQVAPELVDEVDRHDNRYLRLRGDATTGALRVALRVARERFGPDLALCEPDVSEEALRQLKFAELLPPDLGRRTLSVRLGDPAGAAAVLDRPIL